MQNRNDISIDTNILMERFGQKEMDIVVLQSQLSTYIKIVENLTKQIEELKKNAKGVENGEDKLE